MAGSSINTYSEKLKNLTGMQFGRLTVLQRAPNNKAKRRWLCRCECGTLRIVNGYALRSGETRSCGCLRRETFPRLLTTHGMCTTPEYKAWAHARERCTNPNCNRYPYYGGRGIYMCQEWMDSFEAFLRDMGPRPPGTSLDRIDNNGPYTGPCAEYPTGNCRWATRQEQALNTRRAKQYK